MQREDAPRLCCPVLAAKKILGDKRTKADEIGRKRTKADFLAVHRRILR